MLEPCKQVRSIATINQQGSPIARMKRQLLWVLLQETPATPMWDKEGPRGDNTYEIHPSYSRIQCAHLLQTYKRAHAIKARATDACERYVCLVTLAWYRSESCISGTSGGAVAGDTMTRRGTQGRRRITDRPNPDIVGPSRTNPI